MENQFEKGRGTVSGGHEAEPLNATSPPMMVEDSFFWFVFLGAAPEGRRPPSQ